MHHAFTPSSSTAFLLACLCAASTVEAVVKPPPPERDIPLTTYDPPDLHTNQGGRSAGDQAFKPEQELVMITLFEMLAPNFASHGTLSGSVLTMQESYNGPSRHDNLPAMLSPHGTVDRFHDHMLYVLEREPSWHGRSETSLVPAPGALVLLLGGGLIRSRRRRRS